MGKHTITKTIKLKCHGGHNVSIPFETKKYISTIVESDLVTESNSKWYLDIPMLLV